MTLQALFSPAVDALGRPGTTAGTTAIGAIVLPIAFLIGARFGIEGVAGAWIVAHPLLLAIVALRALPVIGLSAGAFLRAVAPAFGAGAAMAGAVTLATHAAGPLSPVPMLALSVAVGAAVYAGSLWLFARSAVLDAWAMLRKS
ncbi:polysaccharide biosynthesis C-terminal domain-containing protein [Sphingomonas hankookensis]